MNARTLLLLAVVLQGAIVLGSGACANDDGADPAVVPSDDGGVQDLPDASEDVRARDAGDAGPRPTRECSDQGFCHTAVPAGETLRGVWGSGDVVWAVSEEGDVLRWDGAVWKVHASGLGALYAIWGSGPTDVWIGGAEGIRRSAGASPDALTFAKVATPGDPAVPIRSIWGASADEVWAVGGLADGSGMAEGKVLRWVASPDGGASFVLDALSSEPVAFTRVFGTATSGVWVGGDDGSGVPQEIGLFRRASNANAFTPIVIPAFAPDEGPESGTPGAFQTAAVFDDGTLLVAGRTKGSQPGYWHGSAGGDAGGFAWGFGRARGLEDPPLWDVFRAGPGEIWACGDYGRLRRWDGASWQQAALMVSQFPVVEPLYAMWGKGPEDFWVVGRNTAIHRRSKGTGP